MSKDLHELARDLFVQSAEQVLASNTQKPESYAKKCYAAAEAFLEEKKQHGHGSEGEKAA